MPDPRRGEVWWVDLEPIKGHEQGGVRPALIVSNDIFNASSAGLVAVVPITTKGKPIRAFMRIDPPEGGLRQVSYIVTDQVRTVSKDRLSRRAGAVTATTLAMVEERLRILLEL